METYKFENGNIITTSGILKDTIVTGRKCKTILPIGKHLIKTTEGALKFSDALWLYGEFNDFRDCVQFWLKATAYRKGLNYVLKITGLSKAAYYRGVSSKHERKNSDFDKYLAGLQPVEVVFNAMYKRYNRDKNVIKLRKESYYRSESSKHELENSDLDEFLAVLNDMYNRDNRDKK